MAKDIKLKLKIDGKTGVATIEKVSKSVKGLEKQTDKSTKNMVTGFKKVKKETDGLTGSFKKLAGIAGVALVIRGMKNLLMDTVALGDKFHKLNIKLGVSVGMLSKLEHHANLSGVSFETVTGSITRMQRRLGLAENGLGAGVQAFKDLNINIKEMLKLSPDEQFLKMADAINKVENEFTKGSLAFGVFGMAGQDLLKMLPAIRKHLDNIRPTINQKDADTFAKFTDQMAEFKRVVENIKIKFFSAVLDDVVKNIDDWVNSNQELIDGGLDSFIEDLTTATGNFSKKLFEVERVFNNIFRRGDVEEVYTSIDSLSNKFGDLVAQGTSFGDALKIVRKEAENTNIRDFKYISTGLNEKIEENLSSSLKKIQEKLEKNLGLIEHKIKSRKGLFSRMFSEEQSKKDIEKFKAQAVRMVDDTKAKMTELINAAAEAKVVVNNIFDVNRTHRVIEPTGVKKQIASDDVINDIKKQAALKAEQAKNDLETLKEWSTVVNSYREKDTEHLKKKLKEQFNMYKEAGADIALLEQIKAAKIEEIDAEQISRAKRDNDILDQVTMTRYAYDMKKVDEWLLYYKEALEKRGKYDEVALKKYQEVRDRHAISPEKLKKKPDAKETSTTPDSTFKQWTDSAQKTGEMISDIGVNTGEMFSSGMSDAFSDMIDGTKSAEDAFKDFAKTFLAEVAKMIVKVLILAAVKKVAGMISGGGSGGGIAGAATAAAAQADGGVFSNGVKKFASGGIVSSPTLFPMANGTGLMGEAGPEAIMPLKRNSSGKLGVETSGGQQAKQQPQNVNITYNINAVDAKSFMELTRRNPEAIIGPFIEQMQMGNRGLHSAVNIAGGR